MRILVVEDDENKRKQVVTFLYECHPNSEILEARSYQSGLRSIIDEHPELIVLDMSMHTFDVSPDEPGGRPQPYAGREILRQMNRRKLNIPVVVITQYDRFGQDNDILTLDELDTQLKTAFPTTYLDAVYYNPTTDGWKDALKQVMEAGLFRKLVNEYFEETNENPHS